MVWNSIWPVGTTSVQANQSTGAANTTYIKTTMGGDPVGTNAAGTRDHFWNVDTNNDGHHRFVKSPAFTEGGIAADPVVGTGMDGVLYLKTTNGTAQWFHANATTPSVPYQATPTVLKGSVTLNTSSYVNIDAVPANVYGEIFLYNTATHNGFATQTGFFRSDATTTESWSIGYKAGTATVTYAVQFGNEAEASGLNIRGKITDSLAPTTAWSYIVTYRAL